jgi:hypothetical protein
MKLDRFQDEIKNYAEQYRTWREPINEFFRWLQQKHNTGWSDQLLLELEEFTNLYKIKNGDISEVINSFLDREYKTYLNATQNECDAIRASFTSHSNSDFEDYLFRYTKRAIENLKAEKDIKWLERGLVGASLENCRIDWRDSLLSLGDLYKAAEDAGINPDPYFVKAASLASRDIPRGGNTPVSVTMRGFTNNWLHPIRTLKRFFAKS